MIGLRLRDSRAGFYCSGRGFVVFILGPCWCRFRPKAVKTLGVPQI